MARTDATGFHSPAIKTTPTLGDYNGVTKVVASTTVDFTGSMAGAGFIVEDLDTVIHCASGGTLPGSTLTADTLYPIGVRKVVNGGSGIVYVLRR
jgi:hypothetical protein